MKHIILSAAVLLTLGLGACSRSDVTFDATSQLAGGGPPEAKTTLTLSGFGNEDATSGAGTLTIENVPGRARIAPTGTYAVTWLRADAGMGNHSFQLYFAGKVAPVLTVSAGAPGFGWRQWDGSHYQESQLAKLSPWQRFGPQLSGAALFVGALVVLIFLLFQIPAARTREKNRMIGMSDVVDATLKDAQLKDVTDDERRKLAGDLAFKCWTSVYNSMKGLEKLVAAKPERRP